MIQGYRETTSPQFHSTGKGQNDGMEEWNEFPLKRNIIIACSYLDRWNSRNYLFLHLVNSSTT
jgi:hypothetical protein